MIWLLAFIPCIVAVVVYVHWHHAVTLWELAILLITPLLFLSLSSCAVECARTLDTEYLGGYVQQAAYYEAWNEYIHKTCSRCLSYDKDGSCSASVSYDCSYVQEHDPYWELATTLGRFFCSEPMFERLTEQFGNKLFVELHRNYHTKDGDKYVTVWRNEPQTIEPVALSHTYENRIPVSNSVYKFQPIDSKRSPVLDYPEVQDLKQATILGPSVRGKQTAQVRLDYWNAVLGGSKQVRIFILLFKGQPLQAGFDQQAYWQGGNKNELVVTIGLTADEVPTWCHVFSWTEREDLKVAVRQAVLSQQPLDLPGFVDWLGPTVEQKWVRKRFRDFAYLQVQPPLWYVVLAFLVVLAMSVGIATWVVQNEHHTGGARDVEKGH